MLSSNFENDELKQQFHEMQFININTNEGTEWSLSNGINFISDFFTGNYSVSGNDLDLLKNVKEWLEAMEQHLKIISIANKPLANKPSVDKDSSLIPNTKYNSLSLFYDKQSEANDVLFINSVQGYHRLKPRYDELKQKKMDKNDKHLYLLLAKLMNCFFGMAQAIKNSQDSIKQNNNLLNDFIAIVYRNHGNISPFNQNIDSTIGISKSNVKANNFSHEGVCRGHVYNWIIQIEKLNKNGNKKFAITHTRDGLAAQSIEGSFHKAFKEAKGFQIRSNDFAKQVNGFVDLLHLDYIFYVAIKYNFSGHAIGARYIKDKDIFEYFDPNFGICQFKGEKNFKSFLTISLGHYLFYGSYLQLELTGFPAVNQEIFSLDDVKQMNNDITDKEYLATISSFILSYQVPFPRYEISSAQENLLRFLPALLNNLDSPKALETLDQNIRKICPELFAKEENQGDFIISLFFTYISFTQKYEMLIHNKVKEIELIELKDFSKKGSE